MEKYNLTQTGQEVQNILNNSTPQSELAAETERAQEAEGALGEGIQQNADDIDALEEKVPAGASASNKLATESYVDDSIATATATFRGTYNLVSDLDLTVDATEQQIATALAGAISTADNNDYAFVQIPTSDETPTEIAEIDKYKYNGSAWAFEYALNNSGFTAAEWAAINSGITSELVTKLGNLPTAAALAEALASKQNVLTFDSVPTEGSNNPVKSGGVYSAIDDEKGARLNSDAALQQAIEAILLLIPSAASSLNQLADKAFVNSSISTATATFRGTFNLVNDLHLTLAATHAQIGTALASAISDEDNNDYCFVQIPTVETAPNEIAQTDRYKFNGSTWEYEYTLNNSGFTSAQWTAINSGITQALVNKLSALPTNADLTTALGMLTSSITTINQKIPSAASQANQLVDKAAMESYIVQVLNVLTASFNVTSSDGHVTVQISQVDGKITSFALTTLDIASAASLSLVEGRVTTAEGNISTNSADIAILQDAYAALTQSALVVVRPTDTWPVASPATSTIYRVVDRVNTPPQYYSDYMWNGTTMVLMATYDNAIDPRPKKASQNLVTSGGVFDNMGALDVSELNATENPHTLAQYVDLSAALAAIPTDYQKGGMSIKFVQNPDHKYVQYMLKAQTWSTVLSNWEKVNSNTIDDKVFYVTDANRNIIAKIDKDGVHSVDFKVGANNVSLITAISNEATAREQGDTAVSELIEEEEARAKDAENTKLNIVIESDKFLFTDNSGYIICKIDSDGIHSVNIDEHPNTVEDNELVITDPNGYIICKIDSDGIHSAKDKHAVACMVLSNSYYPTVAPTRDSDGNVTYAEVMFETGVAGSISITYTNGNSSSVAVVYGNYNYTITINRDMDGNVETVNIQ